MSNDFAKEDPQPSRSQRGQAVYKCGNGVLRAEPSAARGQWSLGANLPGAGGWGSEGKAPSHNVISH